MKTKHHRFWIRCSKVFHHYSPHFPGSPELCHFFKQIVVSVEKEGEAFAKNVYVKTFFERCFYVCFSIRQCKSYFLYRRASCFTNVIARDGDGVPFGKFFAAP